MSFLQNDCTHMDIAVSKRYLGIWAIMTDSQVVREVANVHVDAVVL